MLQREDGERGLIHVAKGRFKRWAVVDMEMNIGIQQKLGKVSFNWAAAVLFCRTAVLQMPRETILVAYQIQVSLLTDLGQYVIVNK